MDLCFKISHSPQLMYCYGITTQVYCKTTQTIYYYYWSRFCKLTKFSQAVLTQGLSCSNSWTVTGADVSSQEDSNSQPPWASLSLCGLPIWSLTWGLKSFQVCILRESTRWKLYCLLQSSLGSHAAPLLPHPTHWKWVTKPSPVPWEGSWCHLLMRGAGVQYIASFRSSLPFFFPRVIGGRTGKSLRGNCFFILSPKSLTISVFLQRKNWGQVIWIIQLISNSGASSRTPGLFNFLWKAKEFRGTTYSSQCCPEGLGQELMDSFLWLARLRLGAQLFVILWREFIDGLSVGKGQCFLEHHSPNLAIRFSLWDGV